MRVARRHLLASGSGLLSICGISPRADHLTTAPGRVTCGLCLARQPPPLPPGTEVPGAVVRRSAEVLDCACQGCGHRWTVLSDEPPARCSSCKRPTWRRVPRPGPGWVKGRPRRRPDGDGAPEPGGTQDP